MEAIGLIVGRLHPRTRAEPAHGLSPACPYRPAAPAGADVTARSASFPAASTDAEALRLRAVHEAAAELRRGVPVLLSGVEPLLVLAAESAGARGLAALARFGRGEAVLLTSPSRAAALLGGAAEGVAEAVALQLPPGTDPATLHGLADPTSPQLWNAPLAGAPAPEAAVAALVLVKLARLLPAAVAVPSTPEAGLAGVPLPAVPAADVLDYPGATAAALRRIAEARVPLEDAGDARIVAFREPDAGTEHLAILIGRPEAVPGSAPAPLVRIHSACFTGDVLGSLRCDCGPQLRGAIRRMAAEGAGALLYLAQEGRGIGLVNKLRAYALQDRGLDTLEANRALGWGGDERNFLVAATMLERLGLARVRLLTNNPAKVAALSACGITVEGRERHVIAPNGVNDHYLATKAERFGHLLK